MTPAAEPRAAPDAFPRQAARTQRYTLGAPRNITVASDGSRVAFLRSGGPEDPVNSLWVLDVGDGTVRCVGDPHRLVGGGGSELPAEERARRERAREAASGFTAYETDRAHRVFASSLGGRLVVGDLAAGTAATWEVPSPVVDPRPDPTGRRVAWVDGRSLWVLDLADPRSSRLVVGDDAPSVRWGVAEFIAAEEMDRHRGYWWAPDGESLLVARVDDGPVATWWIADPADPAAPPTRIAYPAAGTANADVSAWVVDLVGGRSEVSWDRQRWPYLAEAAWDDHGPMLALHPRDQRALQVLAVEPATGATSVLWTDHDDVWVERVPGTPARLQDGRLVVCSDADGVRRLVVDGTAVTPLDLHVRAVEHVGADEVIFNANPIGDATGTAVWRWWAEGVEPISAGPGVHSATVGGHTLVLRSLTPDRCGARVTVLAPPGPDAIRDTPVLQVIDSFAAQPSVQPSPVIRHVGERRLATALLLPHDAHPSERLPVLLDPYGGPHAQRVVQARGAYATSQWFADQGFAVVVIDGRGTPGRGAAWERAIHGDVATVVLEDQLDALTALAEIDPRLDLSRVAIRGWSFGGYLAALAVLRRPEAVHAAVAGAPVTDWRLYDTFYTERYLGHPDRDSEAYDRTSLVRAAPALTRPLLLIHGLADDNVVAAHTLRLSAALQSARRPHQVLPLTGVTHMASQEDVAENLLLVQLQFLRDALALD